MRLEQLKYIITIAKSGSFTEASNRLYIAQPSISQAVNNLEKELQTTIFKRYRTGIVPTPQGLIILKHAQKILDEIETIYSLTGGEKDIIGEINIGTIPALGITLLPDVIKKYREILPNVEIKINELGSSEIIESCKQKKLDIGLVSVHETPAFDNQLSFTPLLDGTLMAYVGKQSSLKNKNNITFKELLPYNLFLFGKEFSLSQYCLKKLNEFGVPKIMSTTHNPDMIKQFVIKTNAVGFGPSISLTNDIYVQNKLLFPITITDAHPIKFGTLMLKNKVSDKKVSIFYQLLLESKFPNI